MSEVRSQKDQLTIVRIQKGLCARREAGTSVARAVELLDGVFLLASGFFVTDGVNGLWISRLIARADQLACIASRVMGLAVSGVSLLVAAFGAAKLASPLVDAWSEGKELAFGSIVVATIALSFVAALMLARRTTVQTS